jgi:hypothetical protein
MKRTEFRIVPMCADTGVRYYIQYKGLFFWKDYLRPVYSLGNTALISDRWHTVEDAVNYIKEQYGQSAKIVTWRGWCSQCQALNRKA